MQEDSVAGAEWDLKGDRVTGIGGWEVVAFGFCCEFSEKSGQDFSQEHDML